MNMFSKGLLVVFCLMIAISAFATDIDGVLQIPKTSVAPEIDGVKDAVWAYAGREAVNVMCVDAGIERDDWLDIYATVGIMWDETNVYYWFEVLDDDLDVSGENAWDNDSIEFYFDGDNSKNDAATGFDENDAQIRYVLYEATSPELAVTGGAAAWTETDFGYNAEITWPVDDMVGWAPEDDLEVGFEVQLNDRENEVREHLVYWQNDSNEAWHDPSVFSDAVFRGEDFGVIQDMFDVPYVAGTPVIDGELDAAYAGLRNVGMNEYCEYALDIMLDETDMEFDAWHAWNEEGWYLFVSVTDDENSVAQEAAWEKDSIELYFDGDNSKNDVNTGYDDNDIQARYVLYDEAPNAGPATALVASVDTDFGWDMEIFWPAADLPFTAEEGAEVGYEIQINDDDANGVRDGMARWWSNSNETWHDPSYMGEAILVGGGSAVDGAIAVPTEFALGQNYPNPFNPVTSIDYTVNARGYVKLAVYDLLGKEVASLVDGVQPAGKNTVQFSASNLTSGVYFYKLEADNNVVTKKMTLLK